MHPPVATSRHGRRRPCPCGQLPTNPDWRPPIAIKRKRRPASRNSSHGSPAPQTLRISRRRLRRNLAPQVARSRTIPSTPLAIQNMPRPSKKTLTRLKSPLKIEPPIASPMPINTSPAMMLPTSVSPWLRNYSYKLARHETDRRRLVGCRVTQGPAFKTQVPIEESRVADRSSMLFVACCPTKRCRQHHRAYDPRS
jgi:hypothetical protein